MLYFKFLMITYKITVESLGRITQLLDSQKIFGAIVYLLSNHLEKEQVDKFVLQVFENDRVFMVSNLIPDDQLPTPYGDIEDSSKEAYQTLKKKKFIPTNLIGSRIRDIPEAEAVKLGEGQDAKYRISNEFFDRPGLKNDLFSIPIIKVLKNKREVSNFNFYLAFDIEDEVTLRLVELLQQLKCEKEVFLYGQNASAISLSMFLT